MSAKDDGSREETPQVSFAVRSRPAIVLLACGCFFQGRTLMVDRGCKEHADDDQ